MIIGVDEAGRGPWAGPLCASCVLMDTTQSFEGLGDSKRMTPRARESIQTTLKKEVLAVGIGWSSSDEIDMYGLSQATKLAMVRAYRQLPRVKAEIIVDGTINYLSEFEDSSALVHGDASVQAISAASCIAKYHRDTYMKQMESRYPEFGFYTHKGYGTKLHQEALKRHGISPLHRRSFAPIKAILEG